MIMDGAQLTFVLSDRHQHSRISLDWWDAMQQHSLGQGCVPGVLQLEPMSVDAICRRGNLQQGQSI
jgi:hypothetical protein